MYQNPIKQSQKYWETQLQKLDNGEYIPKAPKETIRKAIGYKLFEIDNLLFNASL